MQPDRSTKFPAELATGDGASGPLPASSSAGKPKRKPIPVKVQVAVAIAQAYNATDCQGVQCPLCGIPIHPSAPRILEHMTPHATLTALGQDPDTVDNLRWVHVPCAAKKTNGTKTTCASGDLHKVAKAKRLATARAVHDAVKRGEHVRPASRIKGRGFSKVHRPMRRPQP